MPSSLIVIRDAVYEDAPALADTVLLPNQMAFKGLVPDHCLADLTRDESTANWQRALRELSEPAATEFLHVAVNEAGQVVGHIMAGPRPDDPDYPAEIYTLAVLPDHQKSGVGRQLVVSAAERLARIGIHAMQVRTLMINPNRMFYERLGAHYLFEEPYDWDGETLSQAVYGWDDTALLLKP